MSDEKFNQLSQKIIDEGFGDPLRVVVIPEEDVKKRPEWKQGVPHYTIIGGENRWRAGKVLEMVELPCLVYTDWDEREQKLRTVRDNLVTGEMDARKFTDIVRSLDISLDVDPVLFGFEDQTEMDRYLIREKTERDKSFLDGFMAEANKEKEVVESITDIVSNIFNQTRKTIDQSYLFFSYKGQSHCVVLCDKECFGEVQKMTQHLQRTGGDINDFMKEAIGKHLVK